MGGNAIPQFTKNGVVPTALVTAANVKSDGTGTIGTDLFLALTADVTNGTYIERVDFWPVSSVAGTSTTATVGRVFLCSITSGTPTTAQSRLIGEVALPSQSAANTATAVQPVSVPVGYRIPPGWTILVSTHAAPAANTNWRANVIGGDY